MDKEKDNCILTSVLSDGEKCYQAYLTSSHFILHSKEASSNLTTSGYTCQRIHLQEIFAVTHETGNEKSNGSDEIELSPTNQFTIHNIARSNNHKWKTKKLSFACEDCVLCQAWVDGLQNSLADFNRPKKLLVFVNPVGGKKQGVKIFREKVAPLFNMAGIEQDVVVTERANHAYSIVKNADLGSIDGVIAVGGDGMFSEVLNGVLSRDGSTNVPSIKPAIKIGLIPAGSTDTVVFCTTGINDPVTSALHIIIGDDLPIDICSVWRDEKLLKYSVSLMGYGFFGDVIRDSQQLRWMGPRKYDVAGFRNFMANRSYAGELSFLPAPGNSADSPLRERCVSGCEKCSRKETEVSTNDSDCNPTWKTIRGKFISVIGANITCRCAKSLDGISPNAHLGDGYFDLIIIRKTSRMQYLRHMLRMANRQDHFGFDFIEVFKVKEFKFSALPSSQHSIHEVPDNMNENQSTDLISDDTIQSDDVHESPSTGRQRREQSVWNIDGELLDEQHVHVKNHRKLISIFARGIELQEETPTCVPCRRRSQETEF